MQKIAYIEDEELSGLISEVDIKRVNSDHDIMKYLDDNGELRLEASITIFVGGQVLDRGITIPNMINFFYGRDPEKMQQDTVVQHCRMFGYRSPVLLSVTRFYTTNRLFGNLREITLRDEILRDRIIKHDDSSVIYLEAGGDIRACSPVKIMASEINSIGQRDKEHLLALLFASLAHEMFHAIHFADVMTESGRWSYIRKGREKENRVKESMAEYFALSFCMDALSGKYRETAEKIIREMRDKARFPEDPYCGAIVLEDAEKRKGMHGNKSPAYVKIHDESLDDMLAADEVLLNCKE